MARIEADGPLASHGEVADGASSQTLVRAGGRRHESQGLAVVMCQELGSVADPLTRRAFDPGGGSAVSFDAIGAGDLVVRDLVDEVMPEGVFLITGDSRDS